MLRLTTETGQPVHDATGHRVGEVVDFTVALGEDHPRVERLAVGRGRRVTHLVDWDDIESFDHELATLRGAVPAGVSGPVAEQLWPGELLLGRDVLDTQIVDRVGHRVERVADVLLAHLDDGELEVVGVDVGRGAVVRRLGFPKWGERLGERAIDWSQLHLTSQRGHLVQLATPAAALHYMDDGELAHLVARLTTEHASEVLTTVGPTRAAAALEAVHPDVATRISLALDEDELAPMLAALPEKSAHHLAQLRRDRAIRRRFARHRGWRR